MSPSIPPCFQGRPSFAQTELNELHALGLNVRGIEVPGRENGDYYGDLPAAQPPTAWSPALIEHCFLDSAPDRAFLETEIPPRCSSPCRRSPLRTPMPSQSTCSVSSASPASITPGYVEPAITWPILPTQTTETASGFGSRKRAAASWLRLFLLSVSSVFHPGEELLHVLSFCKVLGEGAGAPCGKSMRKACALASALKPSGHKPPPPWSPRLRPH